MRNIDETIQDTHRTVPPYDKIAGFLSGAATKCISQGDSDAEELEKMWDGRAATINQAAEPDIVPTHAKMSGILPQPPAASDKKSDVEKSSDALRWYFEQHQ